MKREVTQRLKWFLPLPTLALLLLALGIVFHNNKGLIVVSSLLLFVCVAAAIFLHKQKMLLP